MFLDILQPMSKFSVPLSLAVSLSLSLIFILIKKSLHDQKNISGMIKHNITMICCHMLSKK